MQRLFSPLKTCKCIREEIQVEVDLLNTWVWPELAIVMLAPTDQRKEFDDI